MPKNKRPLKPPPPPPPLSSTLTLDDYNNDDDDRSSSSSPFAGRTPVKVVSICDLLLAATLLCYYGYKWTFHDPKGVEPLGKGPITVETVIKSQFFLIWTFTITSHSLQFILSLVLLSSAYDHDAEDALGKCQMWWCTSMLLFCGLFLETVGMSYMMVAETGMQPVAASLLIVKLIFRLTAVMNVRNYMKNLKKAPPTSVHQMVYIRSKTKGPPPSNYIRY